MDSTLGPHNLHPRIIRAQIWGLRSEPDDLYIYNIPNIYIYIYVYMQHFRTYTEFLILVDLGGVGPA